jgi:hypothetical protein
MDANTVTTIEKPGQLTLDELIKHGRERLRKEKEEREAREAEEKRKRDEALASIDAEMQKVIPPVLLPLLRPYIGRTNLSADMNENRCAKYSEVAFIYIHLIYFNGKQWEFDSGPRYEVVERRPNDNGTVQYIGSDLALALAIAANITSEWEAEQKAVKPDPTYIPVDEAIQSEPQKVTTPSPFTTAQEKYIRNLVMAICNQFFGG